MSNTLLNECSITYTWGKKYCVEIFKSGKYYISYKRGHVDISKEQKEFFVKLIKNIEPLDSKESLFGKVIELPTSPKLNRWVIRIINQNTRPQNEEVVEKINTENKVYIGKGKYIDKEDYDKVIIHYQAVRYGETIE